MTFELLFRLAIRNLRRNLRRTILTCLTISAGLAVVLWLQALVAGRNVKMVDTITSTTTGHLQVYRKGYLTDRSIQKVFNGVPPNFTNNLGLGAIIAARVSIPSLISSGEESAQIILQGIEPEREALITTIKTKVVEGTYPLPDEICDPGTILIGRPLAKSLNAEVGSKLVLLTQASDGTLGNQLFRVSGFFDTASPNFDMINAFTPLQCAKNLAALSGNHSITVRLPDAALITTAGFLAKLRAQLPDNLQLATWEDASPLIAAMVRFGETTVYLICGVLFAVIGLSIVNIMLINITERTREFGIVLALGFTPNQVRLLVVLESFILAVVATVIGTAIGLAIVSYQHVHGFDVSAAMGGERQIDAFKIDSMTYPIFRFWPYIKIVGFVLLTIVAAGLFPAYRASRLDPVKAINHT